MKAEAKETAEAVLKEESVEETDTVYWSGGTKEVDLTQIMGLFEVISSKTN